MITVALPSTNIDRSSHAFAPRDGDSSPIISPRVNVRKFCSFFVEYFFINFDIFAVTKSVSEESEEYIKTALIVLSLILVVCLFFLMSMLCKFLNFNY